MIDKKKSILIMSHLLSKCVACLIVEGNDDTCNIANVIHMCRWSHQPYNPCAL